MKEKPPQVKLAMLKGDHDALSEMGRKGAAHAAIRNELRKEGLNAAFAEQAKLYSVSPEGDVLPPVTNE